METSVLSPEEERLIIKDVAAAAESLCKEGDAFYLITHRWWHDWLQYVSQETACIPNGFGDDHCEADSAYAKRPSCIDNSNLIFEVKSEDATGNVELQDALMEGRDYVLVPQEVWKRLHNWYGGGPTLERKAICSGALQQELAVEVYPLCLQLISAPRGDKAVVRISKKETVGDLHIQACEMFCLTSEQVRIWDYYGGQKYALMNDMSKTLDEVNLQMNQDILVEVMNGDNLSASDYMHTEFIEKNINSGNLETSKSGISLPDGVNKDSKNCSSELPQNQVIASHARDMDSMYGIQSVGTRGSTAGLTGLLNLGNTCFMNSAIQCLVHTPEFARYFRDDYHQEINWQNPLGMVGELALAFGELLRKLWTSGRTPIAPRPFKAKLARFAPQFSGYSQHDSQELLAFLLDGLHEDLNRVKHKPYFKSKDADGRPDEEIADEYWANHIARNDSIIVDVCQGQYKSTLVCPVCGKVSVTFDPFMYLSLPLQFATSRIMTVTVFSSDGTALPTVCTVSVPKHGRCRDLIQALTGSCSLNTGEKLLLAEIRGHLIHRFLEDPMIMLSTIKDDDHVAAYRLPKFVKNIIFLQLIHRREEIETSDSDGGKGWKIYGTPLVAPISRDDAISRGDVQSIVHTMLSPMFKDEKVLQQNFPHDESSEMDLPNGNNNCAPTKLCLQLVDENNACLDLSVGEDKAIRLSSSSTSISVFINWSTMDLERYDMHYLENLPEVFKFVPVTKKGRVEPLSLYSCLEAFLREEPLVPEDMWFCPQCKEQRQASKKLDLWRLPEVLVIHLKRFSYSRSMKHKLETFVNFPIHDFDVTNYVAHKNGQQHLYELYALSNHYGGMGSGHYTAHIKLLDENRWYNFDDSHISPINEEDVKSAAAYVLFYRRKRTTNNSLINGGASYVDYNLSGRQ